MNPSQQEVESSLAKENSLNIAMSFLASGALRPQEAAAYIGSLEGVDSVLFGASSPNHIKETKDMLEQVLV